MASVNSIQPHKWAIYVKGANLEFALNPGIMIWRAEGGEWTSTATSLNRVDLGRLVMMGFHRIIGKMPLLPGPIDILSYARTTIACGDRGGAVTSQRHDSDDTAALGIDDIISDACRVSIDNPGLSVVPRKHHYMT